MEGLNVRVELLEEKMKVANHRINKVESKVDELVDFKYTVNALSDTVNDLKVTVNKMSEKEVNNYNSIKMVVVTSVIGAIIGFVLGQVFK